MGVVPLLEQFWKNAGKRKENLDCRNRTWEGGCIARETVIPVVQMILYLWLSTARVRSTFDNVSASTEQTAGEKS